LLNFVLNILNFHRSTLASEADLDRNVRFHGILPQNPTDRPSGSAPSKRKLQSFKLYGKSKDRLIDQFASIKMKERKKKLLGEKKSNKLQKVILVET